MKTLAIQLSHLTQLRQLTLSFFIKETANWGQTWSMSSQSVKTLRIYAGSVPWLSKVFFDPSDSWLTYLFFWQKSERTVGRVRFALLGTPKNKDEYEIDIEQEASIRKDHIRALRYYDMRGLSTENVEGTRQPFRRSPSGTLQPRDILEAAGAIKKMGEETSKTASTATELSEADLLRMSLVGMFLMGPLRHLIDQ